MAEIGNLDDWLRDLTAGLAPAPKRYEFRCHPDVFIAIREAADVNTYLPPDGKFIEGSPVFGNADVLVQSELGSGGWELYENGERIKSGRLGEARDEQELCP